MVRGMNWAINSETIVFLSISIPCLWCKVPRLEMHWVLYICFLVIGLSMAVLDTQGLVLVTRVRGQEATRRCMWFGSHCTPCQLPPILAFFDFLAFFRFRFPLLFCVCFPSFPMILGVLRRGKPLPFRGFPCFSKKKKQGLEGQGKVAIPIALYRPQTGPPPRNGEKMGEKWILAPLRNGGKMAEKWENGHFRPIFWPIFPFFGHFSPFFLVCGAKIHFSAILSPFRAGGPSWCLYRAIGIAKLRSPSIAGRERPPPPHCDFQRDGSNRSRFFFFNERERPESNLVCHSQRSEGSYF